MTRNFKIAGTAGLALFAALFVASAAYSHCGHCGMGDDKNGKATAGEAHDCKGKNCPLHKGCGCPAKVEGAEVSVANTAEGVSIVIKGKDAETVKKIQEAGAKMASGKCCGGHGDVHKHKDGKKEEKKN